MLSEENIISRNIEIVEGDITIDITNILGKFLVVINENCIGDKYTFVLDNYKDVLSEIRKFL